MVIFPGMKFKARKGSTLSQTRGNDEQGGNGEQSNRPDSPDQDEEDQGSERETYLKSKLWWFGLLLMAIGESGNFLSYGFAPASVVAPLGTVGQYPAISRL